MTPEPQIQQEISRERLGEAADLRVRPMGHTEARLWAAEQGFGKGREAQ